MGTFKRMDGFRPASDAEQMSPKQVAIYESDMAKMRDKSVREDDGDRISYEEVVYKQKLIEQAGARMVLVIPPYLGEKFFTPKTGNGVPRALNFANPETYPELFSNEHRVDAGHTNSAGSRIYTQLIVKELLNQLNGNTTSR